MARIIGIGETVYRIVLRAGRPQDGMPGGNVFNTMILLGRRGHDAAFISEVGKDRLGQDILDFMRASGLCTDFMYAYHDGRTPLSLAHLEENGGAEYDDYILYPSSSRLDIVWPRIDRDDLLFFGSRYVLLPDVRPVVADLLAYARDRKAVVVYNVDLHDLQPGQAVWLMPSVLENFEVSDVIMMNAYDMQQLYKDNDADRVYRDHVRFYSPVFITECGGAGIFLRTPACRKDYPALAFPACRNLLGVNEAFHAGILHALERRKVSKEMLPALGGEVWDDVILQGREFAAQVAARDEAFVDFVQ